LKISVIEKPVHVQNPESPSRKRGDRPDYTIQGLMVLLGGVAAAEKPPAKE
jgi:hypothetical protein